MAYQTNSAVSDQWGIICYCCSDNNIKCYWVLPNSDASFHASSGLKPQTGVYKARPDGQAPAFRFSRPVGSDVKQSGSGHAIGYQPSTFGQPCGYRHNNDNRRNDRGSDIGNYCCSTKTAGDCQGNSTVKDNGNVNRDNGSECAEGAIAVDGDTQEGGWSLVQRRKRSDNGRGSGRGRGRKWGLRDGRFRSANGSPNMSPDAVPQEHASEVQRKVGRLEQNEVDDKANESTAQKNDETPRNNLNLTSSGGYRRRRYGYQGNRGFQGRGGQAFVEHVDERSNGTGEVVYTPASAETERKACPGGEVEKAVDNDKSSHGTEWCALSLNFLFNYVPESQFRNTFFLFMFFFLTEFSSFSYILYFIG